jgi:hypothetical protein
MIGGLAVGDELVEIGGSFGKKEGEGVDGNGFSLE